MPAEALALVLREHGDLEQAGVDEVREREVDQPVVAPERHCGLRAVGRQRCQAFPFTPGEDDREHPGAAHSAQRIAQRIGSCGDTGGGAGTGERDTIGAVHEKRIEIRWRDVDAFRHVNNAVYATYLEECRDELFERALEGVGDPWDFVLARVAIDFRRELTQADDAVVVRCSVAAGSATPASP